jgi:putative transcriptional regulator
MKIKIKELLDIQGKSVYWLSKETNISQNSLGKIVKGETDSIRFDNLQRICQSLNCTPNDIIDFSSDK